MATDIFEQQGALTMAPGTTGVGGNVFPALDGATVEANMREAHELARMRMEGERIASDLNPLSNVVRADDGDEAALREVGGDVHYAYLVDPRSKANPETRNENIGMEVARYAGVNEWELYQRMAFHHGLRESQEGWTRHDYARRVGEIWQEDERKRQEDEESAYQDFQSKVQHVDFIMPAYLSGAGFRDDEGDDAGRPGTYDEYALTRESERALFELNPELGVKARQVREDIQQVFGDIRPGGDYADAGEFMERLRGVEDFVLEAIGEDADMAQLWYYGLMGLARQWSETRGASAGDEFLQALLQKVENWTGNSGAAMMSVDINLATDPEERRRLEEERDRLNEEWERRAPARRMLAAARAQAMEIGNASRWDAMLRQYAKMGGDTLPYLTPGVGVALGTADTLVAAGTQGRDVALAQYAWGGNPQGYESEDAVTTDVLTQGAIGAAVEFGAGRVVGKALGLGAGGFGVGGKGLAASLRSVAERGAMKVGALSERVAGFAMSGVPQAIATEYTAAVLDEAVIEPISQGLLTYGTGWLLDGLDVPHGKARAFADCFDELRQIWGDGTTLSSLMLFCGTLAGARSRGLYNQVKWFALNKENLGATGAPGHVVAHAMEIKDIDKRVEYVAGEMQRCWAEDPEGTAQRMLAENRRLAEAGKALAYTGKVADAEINPGGALDKAYQASWQRMEQLGLVPHVEAVADGKFRVTRSGKGVQADLDVTTTAQGADVLLRSEIDRAEQAYYRATQQKLKVRGEVAQVAGDIAGEAATRAVKERGGQGMKHAALEELLPEDIVKQVKARGYLSEADMQDLLAYTEGVLDGAAGVAETGVLDRWKAAGIADSFGDMQAFARGLLADWGSRNELAGGQAVGTTAFRTPQNAPVEIDGRKMLGSTVLTLGGRASSTNILEEVVETYLDQVVQARAAELTDADDAAAAAWKEVGDVVSRVREHVVKMDPKAKVEEVDAGRPMSIIEAFSTLAMSEYLTSPRVPDWMRGIQAAMKGCVSSAGALEGVRVALETVDKAAPEVAGKFRELLDSVEGRVATLFERTRVEERDVEAWRHAVGLVEARVNAPGMPGGASVSRVVAEAEDEERAIREREEAEPIEREEKPAAVEAHAGQVLAAHGDPSAPDAVKRCFVGGNCVHNASGNYYVGLVAKGDIREGAIQQVKVGEKGAHGVIAGRELTGDFESTAAPLYLWLRQNGELQLISGRHRFAKLMEDGNVQSHLCYVFVEGESFEGVPFDEKWARMLDYENNMRDDQADEVTAGTYARETGHNDEYMKRKGLLRNASRSKRGIFIGRQAGEELWTRFANGAVTPKDAEIICQLTAPIKDRTRVADIQTTCCTLLDQKKSWEYIGAMAQLLANKEAVTLKQGLLDLGADFEADMDRMARFVERNLQSLSEAIGVLKGDRKLAKKGSKATRLGVSAQLSEEEREQRITDLERIRAEFELIGSNPELIAQAQMWDGKTEIDPVARYLEQAQAAREQEARESGMDAGEYLEEQAAKQAAAEAVPSLFGGSMSLIMGERGAARLTEAVEVLGNLRTARGMLGRRKWHKLTRQEQVKIKLATGWEQDAEGHWVMEAPDLNQVFPEPDVRFMDAAERAYQEHCEAAEEATRIWEERKGKELTAAERKRYDDARRRRDDAWREYKRQRERYRKSGLPKGPLKIEDFIKGTPYEEAYPELKGIKVECRVLRGCAGYFSPLENAIYIDKDCVEPRVKLEIALHEVQHVIQDIEGWGKGGDASLLGKENYRRLTGEVAARNAERRTYMPVGERNLLGELGEYQALLEDTEDVARENQLVRDSHNTLRGGLQAVGDLRMSFSGISADEVMRQWGAADVSRMPQMTRRQKERLVNSAKSLTDGERTILLQLIGLDEGADAAEFPSEAMGGHVQLRQGDGKGGLIHMLSRRQASGLTPLEARLVVVLACFSAGKGEKARTRGNKHEIELNGVRAIVAKDSPESMPVITGYVIDDKKEEIADAAHAALMPRTSYALISLARDLPMGAALGDVVAWFARFVKHNIDWNRHIVRAIMEMKAIQEGKAGMIFSEFGGMSFSTVDGPRNLAAVHTLSLEKLQAVKNLGGMPMPSVAVTRLDRPYTWGGEGAIALVGTPRLGQPGAGNRVWFHDAWSGKMPRMFHRKKNYKQLVQLRDEKIKPALEPYGLADYRDLRNTLFREDNNENIADADDADIRHNYALQAYWAITEKGYHPKPKMETNSSGYADQWANFTPDERRKLTAWSKRHAGKLTDACVREYCAFVRERMSARAKDKGTPARIHERYNDSERYISPTGIDSDIVGEARRWRDAIARGEHKAKKVPDWSANRDRFADYVKKHAREYAEWAARFKERYVGEQVFQMRKQRTNWRGDVVDEWWATMPATLTNLTRYMKQEKRRGNETVSLTPGLLLAYLSDEIKGKREMDWRRERVISTAEYKEKDDAYKDLCAKFYDAVYNNRKKGSYVGIFEAGDGALYEVINMRQDGIPLTDENIREAMKKERSVDWTEDVLALGVKLIRTALEMPTDYMEAIPQRAVKLDEFRYAVMPEALRGNADVRRVLEGTPIQAIYHDGTLEGYEAAMRGLVGSSVAFSTVDMEVASTRALALLEGRADEAYAVEMAKRFRRKLEQLQLFRLGDERDEALRLGRGAQLLAELTGLVDSAEAVLGQAAHTGRLAGLLRWCKVYAQMMQEGRAPAGGELKGGLFDEFTARMRKMQEGARLNGLTEDEVRETMASYAGERLDAAFDKVARHVVECLDGFVKARARERMDYIHEHVYPKREEGQRWPRGKMSADAYRRVERIYQLMEMDSERVATLMESAKRELAELQGEGVEDEEQRKREAELEDELALLSLYGDWEHKSAQEATRAAEAFADDVLHGRREWDERLRAERRRLAWERREIASHFKGARDEQLARVARENAAASSSDLKAGGRGVRAFMNFSHLLHSLEKRLGKRWTTRMRRGLADIHTGMMQGNQELQEWLLTNVREVTGLTSEMDMQTWLEDAHELYDTGITLELPGRTGRCRLTPAEAYAWLRMSREEREARREELQAEFDERRELPDNVPTEEQIEELRHKVASSYVARTARGKELLEEATKEAREMKVRRALEEREAELGRMLTREETEQVRREASRLSKEEWTEVRDRVIAELSLTDDMEAEHHAEGAPQFWELKGNEANPQKLYTSKANMLQAVLTFEQPDYEHLMEPNGITPAILWEMKKQIGPKLLELGYRMRERLNENGEGMAEVYERLTGIPFGFRANYYRGIFDVNKAAQLGEAVDRESGSALPSGKHGMLIPRRYHMSRIPWTQNVSALSVFLDAMRQQTRYTLTAEYIHDARGLLERDADFKQALAAEIGEDASRLMTDWLHLLEGAEVATTKWGRMAQYLLGKAMRGSAIAYLAFNFGTYLKQSTAILNCFIGGYIPDKLGYEDGRVQVLAERGIKFWEMVDALGRVASGKGHVTLAELKADPMFRGREPGKGQALMESAQLGADRKSGTRLGKGAKRVAELGMKPIYLLDIFFNKGGAAVLYEATWASLERNDPQGQLTAEDKDRICRETLRTMLDFAAQPVLRSQMSYHAAAKTLGGIGQMLFLFRSEGVKNFGVMLSQLANGEYGRAAFTVLGLGVMVAAAMQVIDWLRGYSPDDDDEDRYWKMGSKFVLDSLTNDLTSVPGLEVLVQNARWGVEEAISAVSGANVVTPEYRSASAPRRMVNAARREWKNYQEGAPWQKHVRAVAQLARIAGPMASFGVTGKSAAFADAATLAWTAAACGNLARYVADVYDRVHELATGEPAE